MKALPWRAAGARLHLPRDLEASYAVGRMGAATAVDAWPLFWGSPHTARFGFARLLKLGLLRTFERDDPSHPAWYSLTPHGAVWVAERMDCDERELRVVSGIRRMNLPAVRIRNRVWVSLVLACRRTQAVSLALFRPEWELRRLKEAGVPVVPDAMIVLADEAGGGAEGWAWMVEFDSGTERLAVWEKKARDYAALRSRASLYGAACWNVLAVVPTERRARSVAASVARMGAGGFVSLALTDALENGDALAPVVSPASSLAAAPADATRESLVSGPKTPISAPTERCPRTVEGTSSPESGGVP